jgi:hypothetical protein
MMRDIVISPLIDLTWLYVLAGVAVIMSALALWRGLSGWAWRALGLMTLVVLLAQPSLRLLQIAVRRNPLAHALINSAT